MRVFVAGRLCDQAELDRVEYYDPAVNAYELAKDPRCLWGWLPSGERFGSVCALSLGYDGKCRDGCHYSRRPKNWDAAGRAEANA